MDDELELGIPADAKACGNCRLFRAVQRADDGGWRGDCRMMPQRGLFGPEAPICGSFLSRARALPSVLPEAPSRQRRGPAPTPPRLVRHEPVPDRDLGEGFDMTREELKAIIREAVGENAVALAGKWEGGALLLKPGNPELQAKEIPIDALLHKVVMIRDRLRVLEQKINGNAKLSDAEKVDLQQYVTRCYGSLTTFNVLFADERDRFVGEKGEG
ncbi:MAG: hypothetical protein ACYCWW_16030 [Deltaproteobacteria bacterium]